MSNFPINPGPLPVLRLCDRIPQFGTEPGEGALAFGDDRKDLVEHLQRMLKDLGFVLGTTGENNDGVDGIFGKKTKDAVIAFQQDNKHVDDTPLKQDGMVGPRTSDSLNRQLVGKWYDLYETPREITKDHLLVTATVNALKSKIPVTPEDLEDIRLFLVDIRAFRISLFDSDGDPFSFIGEAKFTLLNGEGNVLSEGELKSGEDIVTFASTDPLRVDLSIDGNVYSFPVN